MRSEVLRFLSWTLPAGGALIALAGLLRGAHGVIRAGTAFGLCLTLALITLELAFRSLPKGMVWQLGTILGGSLARSGIALMVAFALYRFVPIFHHWEFWLWMAAMYLGTLAAEITLIHGGLRQQGMTSSTTSAKT